MKNNNTLLKVVSISILAIFVLVTLFTCVIGVGAVVGVASASDVSTDSLIDEYFEFTPRPLGEPVERVSSIWYNPSVSFAEESRMISLISALIRTVPGSGSGEVSSLTLAIFDCDLIVRGDYGYSNSYQKFDAICALNCRYFPTQNGRVTLSLTYYFLDQNASAVSSPIFDTRIVSQYDVNTDLRSVYGVPLGSVDYSSVSLSNRDGWFEFLVPSTYSIDVRPFSILSSIKTLEDSKYENAYIVAGKLFNTESAYDGVRNQILKELSKGIAFDFDSKYLGDEKYETLMNEYIQLKKDKDNLQLKYDNLFDVLQNFQSNTATVNSPLFFGLRRSEVGLTRYEYYDPLNNSGGLFVPDVNVPGAPAEEIRLGDRLAKLENSTFFSMPIFSLNAFNIGNVILQFDDLSGAMPENFMFRYYMNDSVGSYIKSSYTYKVLPDNWRQTTFTLELEYPCTYIIMEVTGIDEFYISSNSHFVVPLNNYSAGFADGVASVDTQKYYDEGFRIGQNKGYLEGSASQGDYTFFGLIGATIDAPLSVFKEMFNFEVLGVNLSGFMLSLFTISIIIVIVKLVIGGK